MYHDGWNRKFIPNERQYVVEEEGIWVLSPIWATCPEEAEAIIRSHIASELRQPVLSTWRSLCAKLLSKKVLNVREKN